MMGLVAVLAAILLRSSRKQAPVAARAGGSLKVEISAKGILGSDANNAPPLPAGTFRPETGKATDRSPAGAVPSVPAEMVPSTPASAVQVPLQATPARKLAQASEALNRGAYRDALDAAEALLAENRGLDAAKTVALDAVIRLATGEIEDLVGLIRPEL